MQVLIVWLPFNRLVSPTGSKKKKKYRCSVYKSSTFMLPGNDTVDLTINDDNNKNKLLYIM